MYFYKIKEIIMKKLFAFVICAVLSISLAATLNAKQKKIANAKEEVSASAIPDSEIESAANKILTSEQSLKFQTLKVTVSNGMATLSGTTDNLPIKRRAEKLVQTINGVKEVVNNAEIRDSSFKDRKTIVAVNRLLELYPKLKHDEIDVGFLKSKAHLYGTASSYGLKQNIENIIAGINGVREIEDELEIVYAKSPSDAGIVESVKEIFSLIPYLSGSAVEVSSDQGNVSLSGTVGSAAEKMIATNTAWVLGVKSVNAANLLVAPKPKAEYAKTPKSLSTNDEAIVKNMKALLNFDSRTSGAEITIKSVAGKVSLSGDVKSYRAKLAAEEDSFMVPGVWKVANHIHVKPQSKIEDNDLAAIIRDMLSSDSLLYEHKFMISVRGGDVNADGEVPNEFLSKYLTYLLSAVNGVEDVNNNLDVKEIPLKSDAEIKSAIEYNLTWDALVDSANVKVDVMKGEATISGEVESYAALKLILADAFRGGAKKINSQVKIKGEAEYDGETFKSPEYFVWPFGL
jgi:osmotically-inducible protein OsmY